MSEAPGPPPSDAGREVDEPRWEDPWPRPAGEQHNIGVPASTPLSHGPWDPPPVQGQHWAQTAHQRPRPGYAPPDPAAVGGPPWPALVAVGHYVPPRMIRWPIVVGFLALAVAVLIPVAISGSSTVSHRVWVAEHIGTIDTINQDAQATVSDNPAKGGPVTKWIDDWGKLHSDVAAAASLPNPGGSATGPWREMINDYYNGSAEIVQGVRTGNQALISRALRDLTAGDTAARQFDRAMGLSSA